MAPVRTLSTHWNPLLNTRNSQLDPLDLFDVRSELTDDERMVQDTVARFVDDEAIPLMREAFEQHLFPREMVPMIADLGLLGSSIDGYDCAGLNSICYGLICQELERGDSGLRSFVSVQSSLCMFPIHAYGSEEQKERWLPAMARGEAIGCFGLTEPHGGSDPGNMKTHAKRDGDDWVINGSKMWITNGNIADLAIIWAMTEDGVKELKKKHHEGYKLYEKYGKNQAPNVQLQLQGMQIQPGAVPQLKLQNLLPRAGRDAPEKESREEQLDKASQELRKAIELDPNDVAAASDLGPISKTGWSTAPTWASARTCTSTWRGRSRNRSSSMRSSPKALRSSAMRAARSRTGTE